MKKNERQLRAEARRQRAILRRVRLEQVEPDLDTVRGAEAISLATQLTRESWSISGRAWPQYGRAETAYRFVPEPASDRTSQ